MKSAGLAAGLADLRVEEASVEPKIRCIPTFDILDDVKLDSNFLPGRPGWQVGWQKFDFQSTTANALTTSHDGIIDSSVFYHGIILAATDEAKIYYNPIYTST